MHTAFSDLMGPYSIVQWFVNYYLLSFHNNAELSIKLRIQYF